MLEEVGEEVMVVLASAQNVTEQDVELCGQVVHVHAESPEARVGLIIKVVIQTMLLTQLSYLRVIVEFIELLQKSLLVNFSRYLLTKIQIIWIRLD